MRVVVVGARHHRAHLRASRCSTRRRGPRSPCSTPADRLGGKHPHHAVRRATGRRRRRRVPRPGARRHRAVRAPRARPRSMVTPAERTAYLFARGELRRFPEGGVLGVPTDLDALAASGVISAEGVDRAALDLTMGPDPEPRRDAARTAATSRSASLVRRRLGDEVYEVLVGPLLSGVNAGDADELSVAAGAPQFAAALRDHGSLIAGARAQRAAAAAGPGADAPVFYGLDGGMGSLVDALVAEITTLGGRIVPGHRTGVRAPDRPRRQPPRARRSPTGRHTARRRRRRAGHAAARDRAAARAAAARRGPRHGRGRVRIGRDGHPRGAQGPDRPPARRQRLPRPRIARGCC